MSFTVIMQLAVVAIYIPLGLEMPAQWRDTKRVYFGLVSLLMVVQGIIPGVWEAWHRMRLEGENATGALSACIVLWSVWVMPKTGQPNRRKG